MLRLYWAMRHPLTHGALVAVWHHGRIMLIRNSYTNCYTVPGGYRRRGETARRAAARELAEEVGIVVPEQRLAPALEITHYWDHKHDHVCLYSLDLTEQPFLRLDNREVVEAGFYPPRLALTLELFPPVRRHIESTFQSPGPAEADPPSPRTGANAARPGGFS